MRFRPPVCRWSRARPSTPQFLLLAESLARPRPEAVLHVCPVGLSGTLATQEQGLVRQPLLSSGRHTAACRLARCAQKPMARPTARRRRRHGGRIADLRFRKTVLPHLSFRYKPGERLFSQGFCSIPFPKRNQCQCSELLTVAQFAGYRAFGISGDRAAGCTASQHRSYSSVLSVGFCASSGGSLRTKTFSTCAISTPDGDPLRNIPRDTAERMAPMTQHAATSAATASPSVSVNSCSASALAPRGI